MILSENLTIQGAPELRASRLREKHLLHPGTNTKFMVKEIEKNRNSLENKNEFIEDTPDEWYLSIVD